MPLNVPCDVTDSIRLRSSRSNPFMTDRTVMSVATPSISPSTDIRATNETNPRRWVERRYRVPINHSYALFITKSFGGLGAGSANRRIYCRGARQQERTHTDDDDVEGSHAHNHHQDERHHGLFDADGAEVVGVVLRPVEQLEIAGKPGSQLTRECRRGQRVTESDSQTLSCAAARRECSDIINVG